MPVFLIIGNHDNRDNFFAVFGSRHPFALPYAQYVETVNGYDLVFLDTQEDRMQVPEPGRLAWSLPIRSAQTERGAAVHAPSSGGAHAPALDAKGLTNWPDSMPCSPGTGRRSTSSTAIATVRCKAMSRHLFTGLVDVRSGYTDLKLKGRAVTPNHYGVAVRRRTGGVHLQESTIWPAAVRERSASRISSACAPSAA